MAVQMPCPLCNKIQSPTLNPKTDEVSCETCGQIIPNVNHFIKAQLKALKQYAEPKKTPFAVKCQKCGKEEKPKNNNGDIVCAACGEPHAHLSPAFKLMLKSILGKVDKDV